MKTSAVQPLLIVALAAVPALLQAQDPPPPPDGADRCVCLQPVGDMGERLTLTRARMVELAPALRQAAPPARLGLELTGDRSRGGEVSDPNHLRTIVASYRVGERVTLRVWRDRAEIRLEGEVR